VLKTEGKESEMADESTTVENERLIHIRRIDAEISKIFTEIEEMRAETMKIQTESKWHPFVVVAGIFGAAIAIVKLFV
jgi:hypothetical protein